MTRNGRLIIIILIAVIILASFLVGLISFDMFSGSQYNEIEIDRNISSPLVPNSSDISFTVRDGSSSYSSNESENSGVVWDCTAYRVCKRDEIQQTYRACSTWWAPDQNESDKCIRTSKGLKEVSLVSDRANHVTAPYTKQNYSTQSWGSREIFRESDYSSDALSRPWNIEIINSSQKLVSTRDGDIYLMSDSEVIDKHDLDVYWNETGAGLLGIVAHPEFDQNRKIYAYYSYAGDEEFQDDSYGLSRVSSFQMGQNLENETVLIDKIPGSKEHYGGRMRIGPKEDNLFITTGDAYEPKKSQEKSFLGGKILRISLTGEIPKDNPWENEVYAKGLRNPQGIEFHPFNDSTLITQHGPWRRDELRRMTKGGIGPQPEACKFSDPTNLNQSQPFFCSQTYTLSPSGMAVVDDPNHRWYGDVFVATLRGRSIHRFMFDENLNLIKNEVFYVSQNEKLSSRIRDIEFQNGQLWAIGDAEGIVRIEPR